MPLENWLKAGRLNKHTTSKEEIEAIYSVVNRCLKDASIKGLSSDQKFIQSYQAALEAAMALIYCNGYKPTKIGHHYTAWGCIRELLSSEQHQAIELFEKAAKKRNKLNYDTAGLASQGDADVLYDMAHSFVDFIKEEISKLNYL